MSPESNHDWLQSLARERGWRVGDGATAVRAWAMLVDETSRSALVPALVERLHCPACWTELDPGESPDFLGCPSCGHGMSLVAIENPYRCRQCDRVTEGPPDEPLHVPPYAPEAHSCRGAFERTPYLPFLVAHTDHVLEPVPRAVFAPHGVEAAHRAVLSQWRAWTSRAGATLHAAPELELTVPEGEWR